MEHRGSKDGGGKAVHIKLKTDGKQDPRSVKADGKSALKKDHLSPDNSEPSVDTISDKSERSLQNTHTEHEAKKEKSKDKAEKVEEAKKIVASRLEEVAEKDKPSTKLNVENEQNKASKDEAEKVEEAKKIVASRLEEVAEKDKPATKLNVENQQNKASKDKAEKVEEAKKIVASRLEEEAEKDKPATKLNFENEQDKASKDKAEKDEQAKKIVASTLEEVAEKDKPATKLTIENEQDKASKDKAEKDEQAKKIVASTLEEAAEKDKPATKLTIENEQDKASKTENQSSLEEVKAEVSTNEDVERMENTLSEGDLPGDAMNKKTSQLHSLQGESNSEVFSKSRTGDPQPITHPSKTEDVPQEGTYAKNPALSQESITSKVGIHDDDKARDTPSTKISIKVRSKTTEDLDQSTIEEKSGNNIADEGQTSEINDETVNSGIKTTSRSNETENQDSTDAGQTNAEEESTTAKELQTQRTESNKPTGTQDNVINEPDPDEKSLEGTKGSEKNNQEKQEDKSDGEDGLRITLERTTGSEDLKVNEMKARVRPGTVFVVRGDPDCYSVRWAEKRKVLAYKVGSKNTSRFSTVLIDTVEQLERASVRHPSIISELAHPKNGAKGSLLSTYFAGADARRSIKDNFIREVGTNTSDHHPNEFEVKQKSPDYDFFAKDHISPDVEVFGGVVPKKSTTESLIQPDNYNYPYLTDYDVYHERKGNENQ